MIVEVSGFLNDLKDGTVVMADRGFKGVEGLMLQRNCMLVRPASVFAGVRSKEEEVRSSRSIAAIRIHVESYKASKRICFPSSPFLYKLELDFY